VGEAVGVRVAGCVGETVGKGVGKYCVGAAVGDTVGEAGDKVVLVDSPSESPAAPFVGGLLEGAPTGVSVVDGVVGSPPSEPPAGPSVGMLGLLGKGMSDGVGPPVGDTVGERELGRGVGDVVGVPVGDAVGDLDG
jgi:hypothetical protein